MFLNVGYNRIIHFKTIYFKTLGGHHENLYYEFGKNRFSGQDRPTLAQSLQKDSFIISKKGTHMGGNGLYTKLIQGLF